MEFNIETLSSAISQLVENGELKFEISIKIVGYEPKDEFVIERPYLLDGQIKGIQGLANFLKCSPSTAQKLKNNRILPFYEKGSRLIFYQDEIMKALKELDKKPCFLKK